MTLRPLALLLSAILAQDSGTYRLFLPSDATVEDLRPATESAFLQAGQTGEQFGVRIQMEISRGGQPFRAVSLVTPVCTGDSVALTLTPSAGGYLNIMALGTSGRWAWIYSPSGDGRPDFAPGRPARIPAEAGWGFPITGDPGQERLLLFFSPSPMSGELIRFQRKLLGVKEPPPDSTGGGGRGPTVGVLRDVGQASSAYVVGQGEQSVVITLDHRAQCPELP